MRKVFVTSYLRCPQPDPAYTGWLDNDLAQLKYLFTANCTLTHICRNMNKTGQDVLDKLYALGLLNREDDKYYRIEPEEEVSHVRKVYDTRALKLEEGSPKPERFGLTWSKPELDHLSDLFKDGSNLQSICYHLKRPAAGVLAKLVQLRYLDRDNYGVHYTRLRPASEPTRQEIDNIRIQLQPPVDEMLRHRSVNSTQLRFLVETSFGESLITKEIIMSKPLTIETKTFICGQDAVNLSDGQIFSIIKDLENQIEALEKITTKPKKLEARIAAMHKEIEALVAYVDARP